MPKSDLEQIIIESANRFAMQIVAAIKNATLDELIRLQPGKSNVATPKNAAKSESTGTKRRGRPPGNKVVDTAAGAKRGRKPGPKAAVVVDDEPAPAKKARKKRTSFPKCAVTSCTKHRFPKGDGFCGEHYRLWKAGKLKASTYHKE